MQDKCAGIILILRQSYASAHGFVSRNTILLEGKSKLSAASATAIDNSSHYATIVDKYQIRLVTQKIQELAYS